MAKRGVFVTAVLLVLGVGQTFAQGGLTGEWEMQLTTQTGVTTWQARFEQNGDQVGGEIDLGDNEVLSVDGNLDGSTLRFVIVVPDLDGDQPINFEGEVSGDTIAGAPGAFSWYGTGGWTAQRK
ncbi:uncharacterized protein METZ01_LOCUS55955 [marine metagenome]|uniref:Uncharacterized protein n=1 Tax=marine metagenome TaxID=408172 RepID=A0A381SIE6_9ZZZZ